MKKLIVIVAAALLLIPAAGAQTPQVLGSKGAVVKEWNNPAGSKKQALENVFTYNEKGQLVDEIHYKDNKLVDRSIYEYDESGKIVREIFPHFIQQTLEIIRRKLRRQRLYLTGRSAVYAAFVTAQCQL